MAVSTSRARRRRLFQFARPGAAAAAAALSSVAGARGLRERHQPGDTARRPHRGPAAEDNPDVSAADLWRRLVAGARALPLPASDLEPGSSNPELFACGRRAPSARDGVVVALSAPAYARENKGSPASRG